jgi:hypothetical protein
MALTKVSYSMIDGIFLNVNDYGADPTGATDSTTAIQAAIDAATAAKQRVVGVGTYRISSKVVIKCDADFSQATFNVYSTPAVAVEISTGNAANPTTELFNVVVWLPKRIENMTKPATGWVGQGDGVRTVNTYSCKIFIGNIVNFFYGFYVTSYGTGNVYNEYFVGHLENNKINLQLNPGNSTGYTNENNFYGGRYSHYSNEGTNVAGVNNIVLQDAISTVNNNVFYKPSLEGDVVQWHFACYGSYNTVIQGRWEAVAPKVLYASTDQYQGSENLILGGYKVDDIAYTFSGSLGLSKNKTIGYAVSYITLDLGDKYSNQNSSSDPIHLFYESGTRPETATATQWSVKHSSQTLQGKQKADTYARIKLNYITGSIYFDNGTTASPTVFIGAYGANDVALNGANWHAATDNTYSLGTAGLRWSVVYAGTGTINTSDANQKQDVSALDAAEQATALAIKGLMKKFKFKSAVAEKGAGARYHFGVIAQEVQAAFADNGLDATKYGLFCSDTWHTLNGEIVPAETDGAVEVTQLGIRYDELLCFVIGAM